MVFLSQDGSKAYYPRDDEQPARIEQDRGGRQEEFHIQSSERP